MLNLQIFRLGMKQSKMSYNVLIWNKQMTAVRFKANTLRRS